MRLHLFAALFLSAFAGAGAAADAYQAGALRVTHPFARPTVPHQTIGAAYLGIENLGKTGDTLVNFSTPIAKEVELHTMSMEGDIMRMRALSELTLAPAQKVAMKPGDGAHLMLIDIKQPLKNGDKFPLTLYFKKSGKLEITVNVEQFNEK